MFKLNTIPPSVLLEIGKGAGLLSYIKSEDLSADFKISGHCHFNSLVKIKYSLKSIDLKFLNGNERKLRLDQS